MMGERQFGPYRLVKQIAVGGMAELYLAKTRGIAGFEKYVALKMIHPNYSEDESFIQMLIDEAKISVQLQHVNIAQTFDLGRVGDTYYITMEFVDGVDLYKLLRRASERGIEMPVEVAAHIAKEMAGGLDYAHRRRDHGGRPLGIVHRDVSPQNVLISRAGEVKLVDFGIAKATSKVRQTAVGVIKGKYYYMSPEQAWGDQVDHRSDIFSAGILLYESLVGQMLYLEEDLHRLLDMVRKAEIAPPSTLRRDIPPQLERIVMQALRKKREERYQTAGDMVSDLERFLHRYAPVFTPAKIADFFQLVIGDESISVEIIPESVEMPSIVTMRIEEEDLIRERSELSHENSIIFHLEDMQPGGPGDRPRAERSPSASGQHGRSRQPTSTRPIPIELARPADEILDGIEEQTLVEPPPALPASAELSESGEYEPTLVRRQPAAGHVDEDDGSDFSESGPTVKRGKGEVREMVAEVRATEAADPPPASSSRRKAPAHPALSASTPQPAVSELKQPRLSRKTPAKGTEAAAPSVLSSLLGGAMGPPVRRTTVDPFGQTEPQPAIRRPETGQPGSEPAAGPIVATAGAPDPFSPLPSGPPALSLTKQLAALEIDEIPPAYKLGRKEAPRWLLRVGLALACVIAGVVLGVMFFASRSGPQGTALIIESVPRGARIMVNGKLLPDVTPVRWPDAKPGARYTLQAELEGYQPHTQDVVVGSGGRDVKVTLILLKR